MCFMGFSFEKKVINGKSVGYRFLNGTLSLLAEFTRVKDCF